MFVNFVYVSVFFSTVTFSNYVNKVYLVPSSTRYISYQMSKPLMFLFALVLAVLLCYDMFESSVFCIWVYTSLSLSLFHFETSRFWRANTASSLAKRKCYFRDLFCTHVGTCTPLYYVLNRCSTAPWKLLARVRRFVAYFAGNSAQIGSLTTV